jgi:hypothetical protein
MFGTVDESNKETLSNSRSSGDEDGNSTGNTKEEF